MNNFFINFRLMTIAICGSLPFIATGQTPTTLNGTWTLDFKQTEGNLRQVGPPTSNAEWLPSILMTQCMQTLTFDGENMTVDSISPHPMPQSFRLVSLQGKDLTYSIQTLDGGKDTLTIAFLNKESITVKSAKVEIDGFAVWKRGERQERQVTENDFKHALDACVAAVKNLPATKR